MGKKVRLLLVSGGSLVGDNILDALEGRRADVELFATNSDASADGLGRFDGVYLVPPTRGDAAAFERRLLEVMQRVAPDLVIPCRDDDVVFLAGLKERRADLSARLLCGSRAVALATCDKSLSQRFCADRGLPFVPTLAAPAGEEEARAFARRHGFPLLAKPVRGYASRGVRLLLDEAQLLRAAVSDGCLIQRYLGDGDAVFAAHRELVENGVPLFHTFEGLKYSIQVMIGPDGAHAGTFCSVNVNRHGTSLSLERDRDADGRALAGRCAEALSAAGWRGPVNVQCQRTPEGDLYIYEFNARFSGATAARRLMGYDEVGLAIELFTGTAIAPNPAAPGAGRVTRVAVDTVPQSPVGEALEAQGFWERRRG